jgi:hypothetical protein
MWLRGEAEADMEYKRTTQVPQKTYLGPDDILRITTFLTAQTLFSGKS